MATETMTTMTIEQPLDGVLVATLNRPDRLNAMTNQMFDELEALALQHQRSDLRALIMTGAGRAFCAGFDLADAEGLSSLSPMGMLTQQERAARALSRAARRCRSRSSPPSTARRPAAGWRSRWPPTSGSARRARASTPRSCGSGSRPATSARRGCCRA